MKWHAYWLALVSLLFGALFIKNSRTHRDKTRQWQIGKSAIECILLVLAAAFMPAILVVYGSMALTKHIKRPAFRIAAGIGAGTILMMLVGWALEVLIILGVFSIDLLSNDFLGHMKERREKRERGKELTNEGLA